MPQTALRIDEKNIVAITTSVPGGLHIAMYGADEEFKPVGEAQTFADPDRTEEEWHRSIRIDAAAQGHYQPRFSTNPEWNPDKPKEDGNQKEEDNKEKS